MTVDAFVNNSGCGPGGYEDYTALSPIQLAVSTGANVSISIANYWGSDKVTVWIDLNADLTFGAGEDFDLPNPTAAGSGSATVVVSGTITIPACTPPGLGRRMRVAMNYGLADPQPACGTHAFGAWEDYLVDITGPIVGDTCECAIPAVLGANAGSGVGATLDTTACNGFDPNVWYSFTPATSDSYELTVTGGPYVGGIYTGVCGSLSNVACPFGDTILPLTAGVTYYIEIIDWIGSAFTLNVNTFVPAVNDECSGALPIFAGVTAGLTNAVGASDSAGSPCGAIGQDLWYSFTASCSGSHTLTTCGYTFDDTVIAVYDACGGTLLDCNDDTCGLQSSVTVSMTAGTTYLVRLGGFASGVFNTSLEIVNPFQLTFPVTPGFISMCMTGGTPFGGYFAAITVNQGAFPNGTFYGIDITFTELFFQLSAGAPFIGILDGNGGVQHGPYAVPPFLTLYGVALNNIFVPGFTATAPTSVTTI